MIGVNQECRLPTNKSSVAGYAAYRILKQMQETIAVSRANLK